MTKDDFYSCEKLILEKDDSAKNQHKFYIIQKGKNEHWMAMWGRKGKEPQGKMEYSKAEIFKKYNEKIKKGYSLIMKFSEKSQAFHEFLSEIGDGWELPD